MYYYYTVRLIYINPSYRGASQGKGLLRLTPSYRKRPVKVNGKTGKINLTDPLRKSVKFFTMFL